MKSNQVMNILFWHKKSKAGKDGYATVICRITIDGMEKEFSTSKKVDTDHWDLVTKRASGGRDHKAVNLTLSDVESDLETHFKVLRMSHGFVTPQMVRNA
ncbi:Arm DNA-binding domain-containing protein [Pedobacter frigidisoli]|uniref:Arm DNA-binding domain-containing protein n=1 Tax=Pedobacter frigidisoli TaxID=2530455 RepID=UPI00292ED65B|nr:Arm DNA-binding domain-containing protein [Pedobacter frigidisoli]